MPDDSYPSVLACVRLHNRRVIEVVDPWLWAVTPGFSPKQFDFPGLARRAEARLWGLFAPSLPRAEARGDCPNPTMRSSVLFRRDCQNTVIRSSALSVLSV